jgi:hypothetical protein
MFLKSFDLCFTSTKLRRSTLRHPSASVRCVVQRRIEFCRRLKTLSTAWLFFSFAAAGLPASLQTLRQFHARLLDQAPNRFSPASTAISCESLARYGRLVPISSSRGRKLALSQCASAFASALRHQVRLRGGEVYTLSREVQAWDGQGTSGRTAAVLPSPPSHPGASASEAFQHALAARAVGLREHNSAGQQNFHWASESGRPPPRRHLRPRTAAPAWRA